MKKITLTTIAMLMLFTGCNNAADKAEIERLKAENEALKSSAIETTISEESQTVIVATSIVLSTNDISLTEGEKFELSYIVIPSEASMEDFKWISADTNIAMVDGNGVITAISSGNTNIIFSNSDGVMATCKVSVVQKPAYDRLSDEEKYFVDLFISQKDRIVNPQGIEIVKIEKIDDEKGTTFAIDLYATNRMGGRNQMTAMLTQTELFESSRKVETETNYDIKLINQAIHDILTATSAEE